MNTTENQTAESARIVALAGDWHGNTEWAQNSLILLARFGIDRVYHLGDFGIWPGDQGERYLDRVNAAAVRFGIDIMVTPGNHEDYDQIAALYGRRRSYIRPNIRIMPRGLRWEDGGRTFVSLGGAPSIDFEQRTEGISWWRGEMITQTEVDRVVGDGHADVMLCHDAPDGGTEAVQRIIDTPPGQSMWSTAGLNYAREGRMLMNVAVAGVRPKVFAHGHYHAPDDTNRGETRYLSLGCDNQPRNLALLRLADLAVSWDGSFPDPITSPGEV